MHDTMTGKSLLRRRISNAWLSCATSSDVWCDADAHTAHVKRSHLRYGSRIMTNGNWQGVINLIIFISWTSLTSAVKRSCGRGVWTRPVKKMKIKCARAREGILGTGARQLHAWWRNVLFTNHITNINWYASSLEHAGASLRIACVAYKAS
jgi:hypothetical protein